MSDNPVWIHPETIVKRLTVEEKVHIADEFVLTMHGKSKGADSTKAKLRDLAMCAHVWVEGRR